MNSKTRILSYVLYGLVASMVIFLILNNVFAWYTGISNDAIANSNEIKTVTTGYGGRFTTETDYTAHTETVHQEDDTVVTKTDVKPGDVLFFTFIMEFDYDQGDALKGATYQIQIVLNAGYESQTDYRGVATGDFYSYLYNISIPTNSCTMAIAKKEAENTSYKYTVVSSPTISSTGVAHFSSTTNSSGEIACNFNVTFPNAMSYPTDEKIYFMLYLPIFYRDTDELQNNEMNSYLKFASVVYKEVEN